MRKVSKTRPNSTPAGDPDVSPRQRLAIEVLAAGGTVNAAAAAAAVHRTCVTLWAKNDPHYLAALNRAKAEIAAERRAELRKLAEEGLRTIRQLMGPKAPPAVRLRAAIAALQVADGVAGLFPEEGPADPTEIAQLWARDEQLAALDSSTWGLGREPGLDLKED